MTTLADQVVTSGIKRITRTILRVDDAQLARVPDHGPLILVPNHINFLEAPVLYTHLLPRRMTALAKVETWDNPFLRYLFNMGEAIPLRRGEADIAALRRGLAVLEAGHILAVAPEGHRSSTGSLQRGHPGVVFVAMHSGAPLLPLVCFGGEKFRSNMARLRRTDFHIVVGQPFHVDTGGKPASGALRQQIADEVMYQLAALLPPAYRGYYSDLGAATEEHLRFDPPAHSNLRDVQR
jgi:1-acyl-sn-glycerol-3-phosphate acyltransferase